MKKLFAVCLMAATMYSFAGCGKDDTDDNGSDNGGAAIEAPAKKVKKIIIDNIIEAYYTWDGDKLMSISFKDDELDRMDFSYNNGKLSQIAWRGNSLTYTWDGNRIATETIHGGGQDGLVSNYVYTDGKVTKLTQMGYDAWNITWTGDNVESVTYFGEPFSGAIAYDDKHNPLCVPCGQFFLFNSGSALYSLIYPSWSKNNPISNPSFASAGDGSFGPIEYTYDSDGFPLTAKLGAGGMTLTYEY